MEADLTDADLASLPITSAGIVVEPGKGSLHSVGIGFAAHPDGTHQPVVDVVEIHDGYTGRRRFALSTLVHLALNATEAELWSIGGRERDYTGTETPDSTKEMQGG